MANKDFMARLMDTRNPDNQLGPILLSMAVIAVVSLLSILGWWQHYG